MREFVEEILLPMFVIVLLFALVAALLVATINHVAAPGEMARFEAVRHEASMLACDPSDVRMAAMAVKVTESNAELARLQRYNQQPVVDLFIPDSWNEVKPIVLCKAAK